LTVWPIPTARDSSVTLPVQSIGVSLADEINTPIVDGDYPTATASAQASIRVIANLGADPSETFAVTTTLNNAIVQAAFSVVDGNLAVAIHIEGTGGSGWLEAQSVMLDATMTANQIPPGWLQ
jgi:hypothetical protein